MISTAVTAASKCASRPHSSLVCCGKDSGCLRQAGLDGLSIFSTELFFFPLLSTSIFCFFLEIENKFWKGVSS